MLVAEGLPTKGNIKLTGMVQADAHQNKMVVHPYTVRADQLPDYARSLISCNDILHNKAGVDGLLTDLPDKAVMFLQKMTKGLP